MYTRYDICALDMILWYSANGMAVVPENNNTGTVSLALPPLKTKGRVKKNCKKLKASSFRDHTWKDFCRQQYYFSGFIKLVFKNWENTILTAGCDNWSLIKGDDGRLRWGWEGSYSNTHQKKQDHTHKQSLTFFWHLWHCSSQDDDDQECHNTWWMLSLRLGSDDCSLLHIVTLATARTLRWSHDPPSSL